MKADFNQLDIQNATLLFEQGGLNLIYCDDVTPRPFAFSIGKHNFLV